MKYEYAASECGVLTDGQAAAVGKELTKIEKLKGCIAPPVVVEAAKPQSSRLHKYFTWEDNKAAEAHRLWEARMLIRSVVIIQVVKPHEEPRTVRAFVSVHSNAKEKGFEGRAYISTVKAFADTDYKSQVLQEALNEFTSLKKKYETLKEFSDVFDAIDEVVEKLVLA